MATQIELFEFPDLTELDFCLWGLKKEVHKLKVDTPDELLTRILDAAACIKRHEDQLRRTAGGLRTRVAECREVNSGT